MKKVSAFKNIPPNTLKAIAESCYETLIKPFNNTLLTFSFPAELKSADVGPVSKRRPIRDEKLQTC